jgi:hypothetical protein
VAILAALGPSRPGLGARKAAVVGAVVVVISLDMIGSIGGYGEELV